MRLGRATPRLRVSMAEARDKGRRATNEDAAVTWQSAAGAVGGGPCYYLGAVADGMGGHAAGDVASSMAAKTFAQVVDAAVSRGESDLRAITARAFTEANAKVYSIGLSDARSRGLGTTLTTALLQGNQLCIGHVGDSRAYLVRGEEAGHITKDHTLVQGLVDAGSLTVEQGDRHPQRNQLTKALGAQPTIAPEVSDVMQVQEGDVILLCSDGLHNSFHGAAGERALTNIVRESQDAGAACERLVSAAKKRDGSDNITAVCIGVGDRAFAGAVRKPLHPPRRQTIKMALAAVVMVLVVLVGWQLWPDTQGAGSGGGTTPETGLRLIVDVKSGKASVRLEPVNSGLTVLVNGRLVDPAKRSAELPGAPDQVAELRVSQDAVGTEIWYLSRGEGKQPKVANRGVAVNDGKLDLGRSRSVPIYAHYEFTSYDLLQEKWSKITFHLAGEGGKGIPVTIKRGEVGVVSVPKPGGDPPQPQQETISSTTTDKRPTGGGGGTPSLHRVVTPAQTPPPEPPLTVTIKIAQVADKTGLRLQFSYECVPKVEKDTPLKQKWHIDGQDKHNMSPSMLFTAPKTYTAKLTLTYESKVSDEVEVQFTISKPEAGGLKLQEREAKPMDLKWRP